MDSKQRAHDLACAYAIEYLKCKTPEINISKSTLFEFGKTYIACYNTLLNSISEEESTPWIQL